MKNLYLLLSVLLFTNIVSATVGPITGMHSMCVGATTTLSDTTAGGTWSCSSVVALVNTTTGVVTGTATGLATITYSVGTGFVTTVVTVSPAPAAITIAGYPSSFCSGKTNYLISYPSGGQWSSNDTLVATVAPTGSGEGLFTGVSVGTATISYSMSPGCFVIENITVNPVPALITGVHGVCVGSTTTLNCATAGGYWTVNSWWTASIGSSSGIATGLYPGWKIRTKQGRNKIFSTPEIMWEAACEYFEWCEENPLYRSEAVKSSTLL